jgi:hypothetical protein
MSDIEFGSPGGTYYANIKAFGHLVQATKNQQASLAGLSYRPGVLPKRPLFSTEAEGFRKSSEFLGT